MTVHDDEGYRYLLRHDGPLSSPWVEVTRQQWIEAEYAAGFRGGGWQRPSTAGFSAMNGLVGRLAFPGEALPEGTIELNAVKSEAGGVASEPIGALTAEEWCAFRMRGDDDLLQCCGVTSDFRDALFHILRMGGGQEGAGELFRENWQAMEAHGFPQGDEVAPLLAKLRAFYIDPRREEVE